MRRVLVVPPQRSPFAGEFWRELQGRAWWDVLEVAEGAAAILMDRRAWTTKSRAARRWHTNLLRRKHACGATCRRAVCWSMVGAVERAAGGQEERTAVVLLELVLELTGKSASRIEQDHGHRGVVAVMGLVVAWLRRVLGCEETARPRRRRFGRPNLPEELTAARDADCEPVPATERSRRSRAAA